MNRKEYIVPQIKLHTVEAQQNLAASGLDPTKDDQVITPSDDEFDGEFGAKQSVWDEE